MHSTRTAKRLQRHLGRVKLCHCVLCRYQWVGRQPIAQKRLEIRVKDEFRQGDVQQLNGVQ